MPTSQPIPADELHGYLAQAYSDLYKEQTGIRPRLAYGEFSTDDLGQMVLDLQADAEAAAEWAAIKATQAVKAAAVEAAAACPWMDQAAEANAVGW